MLLEHLKNSLDTRGLPTKFKRVYELLPDGRHSVKWIGSKGNKGQEIFIDTQPDGSRIKCFVCGVNCLTSAVKYQRKNGDHKKRHTCTRKCQDQLTKNHKYNPLVIERDDDGWYLETCKGGANGYIVKRFRPEKGKHRIKVFQHRWVMEQVVGKEAMVGMQVHHIDMKKTNNDISNLWLCTPKQHMSAHHSFNECCEELMGNFNKYKDIQFNKETGKYYLRIKDNA
tara:strand:- start:821 stop:1498 length:678 start_codon:yes stop_codon:yes gene_type:complete